MPTYVASHLKDMNRLKVYNLISGHKEISRAEITRRLGISAPTILKIVDFLVESGLVIDKGEGVSAVGRRPQMFTHNKNRYYSIGVIHEGDYLKAGIANLDCELIGFKRVIARRPFNEVMNGILFEVIDGLLAESGIDKASLLGLGIGLPGAYDPKGQEIITAPLIGVSERTCITGALAVIKERYGVEVIVDNDLNMEVQGEFKSLGLDIKSDLVYVSLGTGLGSGIMLKGELRRGANYMCGEIGYMLFLDDYTAGRHTAGWLEDRVNLNRLKERFGILDGEGISEELHKEIVEYVAAPLALCVNNIVMCLDCGNVSLGGEVFDLLGDRLFEAIEEKVKKFSMADVRLYKKSSIEPGVIGAANMVNNARIKKILCE